jgi:hypothetical protein
MGTLEGTIHGMDSHTGVEVLTVTQFRHRQTKWCANLVGERTKESLALRVTLWHAVCTKS